MKTDAGLPCLKCSRPYTPPETHAREQMVTCTHCGTEQELLLFPAYTRDASGSRAGDLVDTTEAGCFHHPHKQAETVCDTCGRFICSLCATEDRGHPICLNCLDAARQSDDYRFARRRVAWDRTAFTAAVLPIFVVSFFSFLTAPGAVFLSFYGARKPGSIVRRGRAGLIAGGVIGLLQCIGWAVLVVMIAHGL